MDLFESSLDKFKEKSILKRFLNFFAMHFSEKNAQHTGGKAVRNGAEMVINSPQILRFVAMFTRMNLYELPSLKHYFVNKIGDFEGQKFMDKKSFFRIRALLKCVFDVNVDMVNKEKDPLWKVGPVLDSVKHAMLEILQNAENLCVVERNIPFTGGMPNKIVIKSKPRPVGLKQFVWQIHQEPF